MNYSYYFFLETSKLVEKSRPLLSDESNKVLAGQECLSLSSDEDEESDHEDRKSTQSENVDRKQLFVINDIQSLANLSTGIYYLINNYIN